MRCQQIRSQRLSEAVPAKVEHAAEIIEKRGYALREESAILYNSPAEWALSSPVSSSRRTARKHVSTGVEIEMICPLS
jgi:hypothetical protein